MTLDNISTTIPIAPILGSPYFLFVSVFWILGKIIPLFWLQKAMLFLVFFLTGWGMYRLIPVEKQIPRMFAGFFYTINPFVYSRVMAGQWHLLLGYALFPFFVKWITDFFCKPSLMKGLLGAVLVTVITTTSIHYLPVIGFFTLLLAISYYTIHPNNFLTSTRYFIVFIALAFLLNANWIVSTILGTSDVAQSLSVFERGDLIAFQSVPDPKFGLIFNLLSGYGFWAEAHNYFLPVKNIIFFWPIVSLTIIFTTLLGIYHHVKYKQTSNLPFFLTLAVLFLVSLDLSAGVALPSFSQTTYALYEKFPLLRAFREPHKLVGNLMFVYAYLGAYGVSLLSGKVKELRYAILSVFFLALPFIYTPLVFGGFWGQLKPANYPESWRTADNLLKSDKDSFLSVFFPWHFYMRFKFANNRVIANPAPFYFSKPVISSQNYETVSLYTHDTRLEALHVDGLVTIAQEGVNLLGDKVYEKPKWAQDLAVIEVKYVILAKEDDWRKYFQWFGDSNEFENVFEDNYLVVYKNLLFGKELPLPSDIIIPEV